MKTFKESELKTFEQLAMLRQGSLKQILASFLKKHYKQVVHTKDYIFAVGDIPVALVAHLDTVFKNPPTDIFFDQKKNVLWAPNGLGADDRAGVFAIVQIVRAGYKPHIIFTTDEEIGGHGASKLALLDCPFKELKYIIELDRRGSNDCVFYDCENQEFVEYVEQFGFEYNFGSYTDICEFCPAWGIAGVNLSIGYKDEHSTSETLFVGQMLSTIEKVKKMLADAAHIEEAFIYIPSKTAYHYTYGYDWYDYRPRVLKCTSCQKYLMEEELFPVVMLDKDTKFFCPDCLVNDKIAWCNQCSSAYQKAVAAESDTGICPKCVELKEKKANVTKAN